MVGCVLFLMAVHGTLNRPGIGPFLLHSKPGQLALVVKGQPTTLGDVAENQVTLLGWELQSSENPKPGGVVRVRLYCKDVSAGSFSASYIYMRLH